jgi:predicted YcjX-like family ATPase
MLKGHKLKNHKCLADTLNNYFSELVDESVINITKQDHNQTKQHSYLEYLVHECHQPFLSIKFKPVTERKYMRSTRV